MRNTPINKTMGYLVPSLLTTGLFVSSALTAMPVQNMVSTVSKSNQETTVQTKAVSGNLTKSTVLARNTTAKPEPAATTTGKKVEDKKTIGRCWKRLMNMVREVNHAHSSKSK